MDAAATGSLPANSIARVDIREAGTGSRISGFASGSTLQSQTGQWTVNVGFVTPGADYLYEIYVTYAAQNLLTTPVQGNFHAPDAVIQNALVDLTRLGSLKIESFDIPGLPPALQNQNVFIDVIKADGTSASGGSWVPMQNGRVTSPLTFNNLPDGRYVVRAIIDQMRPFKYVMSSQTFNVSSVPSDTTAPVISAVNATNITSSGATITWTTDEASDTQVQYRVNGATTWTNSSLATSFVTSHSLALSGLSASTTYQYQVLSRDPAGNLRTSAPSTLRTPPPSVQLASAVVTPAQNNARFQFNVAGQNFAPNSTLTARVQVLNRNGQVVNSGTQVITVPANGQLAQTANITVGSLNPSTRYTYKISVDGYPQIIQNTFTTSARSSVQLTAAVVTPAQSNARFQFNVAGQNFAPNSTLTARVQVLNPSGQVVNSGTQVITVPANGQLNQAASISVASLNPSTGYTYKISVDGYPQVIQNTFTTLAQPSVQLTATVVTPDTSGGVKLNFRIANLPATTNGFLRVEITQNGNVVPGQMARLTIQNGQVVMPSGGSLTMTGLAAGSGYSFRVSLEGSAQAPVAYNQTFTITQQAVVQSRNNLPVQISGNITPHPQGPTYRQANLRFTIPNPNAASLQGVTQVAFQFLSGGSWLTMRQAPQPMNDLVSNGFGYAAKIGDICSFRIVNASNSNQILGEINFTMPS